MTAEELLAYLAHQGIELWIDGDNLRYRGPKITLPPGLVALLRQHKAQLRELILLNRQSYKDLFPLSFTQKSMWFLHQLNPSSTAYNVHFAAKLQGSFSAPALQAAIDKLGARHHSLRIRYVVRDGLPWQQVETVPSIPLRVIDASAWTEEELTERVRANADRPYDLLGERPARVYLYQRSPTEQILLIGMHHIRVDGWSMAILVRELGALYHNEITGQPAKLPTLAADFSDFIAWQQWLVQGAEGNAQLAYWTKELGNELPPLELPTDRPRPPVRSERGDAVPWTLDPESTRRLRTLAVAEGTTPFSVLLSAFAALLHRYTGQEELLIGTPYHGRSAAKWNDVVGCLLNTLALHVRPRGEQSFLSLLHEVHKQTSEALNHADYPFPLVVEKLRPERDPSRTPLFQVMFAYENFKGSSLMSPLLSQKPGAQAAELFGLPLQPIPISQQEGQFDLNLTVIEDGGSFCGSFCFSTDLFDRETVEQLADRFNVFLRSALDRPNAAIGSVRILSPSERQRVIFDWNPEPPPPQAGDTFPQRFLEQAARTPDALALCFKEDSLTYRELCTRSCQLAHSLREAGVCPDSRVALCLDRSLDLVIGILAIWLSGGTYIPLDPLLPRERLEYQLKDSAATVLLTQEQHARTLPVDGLRVLFADDETLGSRPSSAPPLKLSPGHPAYCIYTSGSTGRPRGVLVEHASVIHLARTLHAALLPPSVPPLRATLAANVVFDASIEMLTLLLRGDSLHVVPAPVRIDASAFVQWSRDHRIDLVDCTPSLLVELLGQGLLSQPDRAPGWIWVGGEAIPDKLWTQLRQAPGTRSINSYGPTESTVDSTLCDLGSAPARPVIGRPFGHVRVYILDGQRNPLPIGIYGEIYLSGPGLARGYLNQPQLTAEKFLPDPFHRGERMYRTGDCGRWLPDGNIEFRGRLDFQVKLRGYRIELGEIESVLASHAAVSSCAVLLREDAPGDKRLCAYAVLCPGAAAEGSELRAHLEAKLPAYMIPSAFVFLDSMPLSPNGKLDRRALPPPSVSAVARGPVPPSTRLEQLVATAFAQVLGLPRVGIQDSFFALGGHSLLGVRLAAELGRLTGQNIPLSILFEHPTVTELAKVLEKESALRLHKTLVLLHPAEGRTPLFCVHPVGGHVLCYVELASSFHPPQQVYGLQATPVAQALAAETLSEVASRYVAAIRSVQPHGPYQLLGWSLGGVLAFEMARQLKRAGETTSLLALLDAYAPEANGEQAGDAYSEAEMQRGFLRNLIGERLSESDTEPFPEDLTRLQRALAHAPATESPLQDRYEAQLAALYALFRRNIQMERAHRPEPYDGRVLLLRAAERPTTRSRDCGWAALCTGELEIVDVPGDHYTLLSPSNHAALAKLIEERLIRLP